MPKINNQPPKKFLSLGLGWAKVVKNGKIFYVKKYPNLSKKNSSKNMILGAHFLLLTFFENFCIS